MVREKNLAVLFKYCLSILLGLSSICLVYFFFDTDYPSLITGIMRGLRKFGDVDKAVHNSEWLAVYYYLKAAFGIGLILICGFLYDACFRREGLPARLMDRVSVAMASIMVTNRNFWRELSPVIRRAFFVAGLLQFGFYLFFVLSVPFHYDEAFSFDYFSGRGFVTTAIYYPLPNNHIFYNLVARLFTYLPFKAQITTRLPSFLISFVSSWYFFKLAFRHFRPGLALLLMILFAGSLPVVMYNVEARGYGFAMACTILLLYSADSFNQAPVARKYYILYGLATVLGFYTIPAFFFTVFPLSVAVGSYLLVKRRGLPLKRFVATLEISAVVTLLLYTPIILVNGPAALSRQTDVDRQPIRQLLHHLVPYLRSLWYFLLGTSLVPLGVSLVLLIATAIIGWTTRHRSRLLPLLLTFMLVSPPFLYLFSPIIPESRSWNFLIIPLVLSLGYILAALNGWLQNIPYLRAVFSRPAVTFSGTICVLLLSFVNFSREHEWRYAIDYQIRDDLRQIGSNVSHIRTIGISNGPWEYYVAEDLFFQCFQRNPFRGVVVHNQFVTGMEDVMILTPDSASRFKHPGYELIGQHPPLYSLFLRQTPDTTTLR